MKTRLHQAPAGPRWILELEYRDTLTPETFERVCREGKKRWQISKMIVLWHLRPPCGLRLTLRVNMDDAIANPPEILGQIARRAARDAIARDIAHLLPPQFHGGETPIVTAAGAPLLGADGRPLTSSSN